MSANNFTPTPDPQASGIAELSADEIDGAVDKRLPRKVLGSPQEGATVALEYGAADLTATFGVGDLDLTVRLLSQLLNVIHPDPASRVEAETVNTALALIRGVRPGNAIEAMIATMMVAAHCAAMDAMRRANHPDQTPAGRQSYGSLSLKAMRTFTQLLESLNHSRGKSVTQRVIVERINLESGAHAVIGAVAVAPRGEGHIEPRHQSLGPAFCGGVEVSIGEERGTS